MAKPPANPFTRYLFVVFLGTLVFAVLGIALELHDLLDLLLLPLLLGCGLLGILYTAWAVRLGSIATVDRLGRVYHYSRKKEPVLFYLLVVLYLGVLLPATLYCAHRLVTN